MTAEHIIGIYVVIDETMRVLGHASHRLAGVSDAEVLTVAVVAAAFLGNHHTRALAVLRATGYLARSLSVSRFSRRLHALADWLALLLDVLGDLFARGQAAICDFIVDSMPVPVCKRMRARRCRTVRGRAYCGYCAVKGKKFFGWRLQLVGTTAGLPVAFTLLPGGWHDLTPIHELTVALPDGAGVYGDKAGAGNVAANAVLTYRQNDGSNQANGYADYTGFPNPYGPYPAGYPSTPPNTSSKIYDPNRWQPLRPAGATQDQTYLTPHWGLVKPFAMSAGGQFRPAALVPQTTPTGGPPAPGYVTQANAILTYSANLTDSMKMIAEFWRPGTAPTSGNVSLQPASTPPGIWAQFGQFVSQRDNHTLDADVKMFFTLATALFDASIACWDCKRYYNYVRPITAIHWIYSGQWAPLYGSTVSAWAGPCKGTQTIPGSSWQPYQPANVVTPPFPEFTSGHSTFSAAGAAALSGFTGSDTFGGTVSFAPGSSSFESACTPKSTVTLSWATFTDAAAQAGQSREYGGIHFIQGDDTAVQMGTDVGNQAYTTAVTYFNGTAKALAP